MLGHGIAELPNGLAEARDVMERVGESIHVEMEKRISVLSVMGTLGPMIGLVGTLMGMIKAFSAIAQGGAELDAQRVAGAISMALVITLEGVSLSVMAIWCFSFFRNRVSVITTNVGIEADQFLRHLAHAARAKSPAAPRAEPARRPVPWRGPSRGRNDGVIMAGLESEGKPNLTPMLDMVFQLITFFMVVANFQAASVAKDLELPVIGSARPVDTRGLESVLVLNIDKDGTLKAHGRTQPVREFLQQEAQAVLLSEGRFHPELALGQELPTLVVIRRTGGRRSATSTAWCGRARNSASASSP